MHLAGARSAAGTRQLAATARRSQARGRARPAHDAGVHREEALEPGDDALKARALVQGGMRTVTW